jgi:hypothetical protein
VDDAVSYSPKMRKAACQQPKHSSVCKTLLTVGATTKLFEHSLNLSRVASVGRGSNKTRGFFVVMIQEFINVL